MGSGNAGVTGPDLGAGVPLAALQEGVPLVGFVGDDAVMIVRRGAELFAVAATCTHYGGPLGDGLVVGDTIRCPWHHATFSLRDGSVVRAPALDPIGCYEVQSSVDRVRVTGRRTSLGAVPRRSDVANVVIVGTGAAGAYAAETLRREGYQGRITLVGQETDLPYDRPNLSKDYLAGTAPEAWIPLRPATFYADRGIDLVLGQRARTIDTSARTLILADGRALAWDRLLITTGAEARTLNVAGVDAPHVRPLRSLADARALIAAASSGGRVAILGASFIGMEAAAALRARGLEVHVIAPDACPFERILGASVGDFIRTVHAERGVVFHLGESPLAIDPDKVVLVDGTTVPADIVALGVGVTPAAALAGTAGLLLAADGGLIVDQFLETSAAGVFAAGDVARWPDPRHQRRMRVEHWVVAQRMGAAAARNLLGAREPFDVVPFFWSSQFDLSLSYVGHADSWDQIDVAGRLEERDCAVAYRAGGQTLAVLTVGRDRVSLAAERALETGDEAALQALVPAA